MIISQDDISQATTLLKNGDIVAFPTETIYGLFGDALNPDAVRKIFLAKNRPADNPLIIHLADKEDIPHYALIENDLQQLLIEKFMPGPFTLILPKKDIVPAITTGGLDTVCIRIPDHNVAREIIRHTGTGLAGPSANTSGKPSPTSAAMVMNDLGDKIPLVIDGGKTLYGIESTVVKVSGSDERMTIHILRPGFITKEDIQLVVGEDILVVYDDKGVNESPGSRYRHYSPSATVSWITQDLTHQILQLDKTQKIAIIATSEYCDIYHDQITAFSNTHDITILPLGSVGNLLECAQNLYQLYRDCDQLGIEAIVIEPLAQDGVGYALMNRIQKSISS